MSDVIEINAEVNGTEALSADVSTNEDITILDDAIIDETIDADVADTDALLADISSNEFIDVGFDESVGGGGSSSDGVKDVKVNGQSVVSNRIAMITMPTKVSDLANDSEFVAASDVAGYLMKTSLVNIYLSATSGSDSNNGASASKAVKTLDKAFRLGLSSGNEFRIRIISNGDYTLSARTVTSICWHIMCQGDATNPTVTFGQLCCYNCHLNFAGMDSSNKMTILCSDLATGWYADNSLCTFQNLDINSHYTQNGGALTMWYCTLHDIRASYSSVKMEYTEIGNSLGRINAIYRHEGGTLVINNGVIINATEGVTYLLDLIGISANIRSNLVGNNSLYTYGVTANGSQIAITNERLSTYGNTIASNGGYFTTGGAASYEALPDKPSIEGVTLQGNKTFPNLNLDVLTNSEIQDIFDNLM